DEQTNDHFKRVKKVSEETAHQEHLREERYRQLVEGVQEYALLILDPEGRIMNWNTGAEALFGYTDSEIIGQPLFLLYSQEDRTAGRLEEKLETTKAEGRAFHDHWFTCKDGSRFWGTGVMTALY